MVGNCSIKVITHLTEKKVILTDTGGNIINESTSNICIEEPYQSYILYMSNPIEITSFSALLSYTDNVFIQFILFAFAVVIAYLFYVFMNVIKNKGFRG